MQNPKQRNSVRFHRKRNMQICIHFRDRKRITSLELVKYEKFCIVVIRFYTKRHSRMRTPVLAWNCNRAVHAQPALNRYMCGPPRNLTRASNCLKGKDKNSERNERKLQEGWKGIEMKERQEEQKMRKINKRLTSPRVVSVMIFTQ